MHSVTTKKALIGGTIISIIFTLGFLSHDPIMKAYTFTTDLFGSDPAQYMAPLTDYEKRTKELHESPKFQAACLAGARAQISLEMAREKKQEAVKYLDEFDRNSVLSQEMIVGDVVSFMGATVASSTKAKK